MAVDGATIVLDDERLILRGRLSVSGRRPCPTHPRDRICGAGGCATRLSIYNSSTFCWQHQLPERFIHRAERRAS